MDIFITLYNIKYVPLIGKVITIHNGFSFGRDKKPEDVDLFFNKDDIISNQIQVAINYYKPKKVWISFIFEQDILKIKSIVDDRWIIGGPVISSAKNNIILNKFLPGNPTFVYTTMEEYLGQDISSNFDPYFLKFTSKFSNYFVAYSMGLSEYNCYWSKCKFCTYSKLDKISNIHFQRKDIEKIIGSAIPTFYKKNMYLTHNCISSTSAPMLKTIVESNINSATFMLFIRADSDILEQIKEIDNLTHYHFTIGAEGFSQSILDCLNKNIKIKTLLEVTEEILKKNGSITFTLMNNYTFLTKDIVDDYINNFKKIEDMYKKYIKNNFLFVLPYYIYFYSSEEAEVDGFESKKEDQIIPVYSSIIPETHEQFRFNKEIDEYISSSIIPSLSWTL